VEESEAASAMLSRCRVFYADRLSAGIVSAMETVASRGGIVFFEPSAVGDRDLFARALASVSIIKCSQDRIQDLEGMLGRQRVYRVVTEGADGLRTGRQGGLTHMPAYVAGSVRDTSGSGDMVSVGLIDHLLKVGARADTISTSDLMSGLRAGQRLAAANCAFIGARGIFRHASPDDARCALNG